MIVGIDVRHLARGPKTGVAAVTCELVEALASCAPEVAFRLFYNGRAPAPPDIAAFVRKYRNVQCIEWHLPNRIFDVGTRLALVPPIDRALGNVDVFFSPHALVVPLRRASRVLIFHDLSFVSHPEFFSPESRLWHWLMRMRQQARAARAIIVPSRATARDLERLWKIPREKIHVVPWAPPQKIPNPKSQILNNPLSSNPQIPNSRNVLFLGTIERRKNVLGLLRAFTLLKMDPVFSNVRLVLAGAMGWGSDAVKPKIQNSKFKNDVELRGYVSEEEKARLLARAALFVYPSFYEGFGLPVLEAMAAGVPVVTSNRTSLPEVAGNAAILVNPQYPEEIAEAMRAILLDDGLASELSRRGQERATQFMWEKTAQAVLEVFQSVLYGKQNSSITV